MSESIKKVFSKGQQDDCYDIHNRVHNISTDLINAQTFLLQGRFFDAMDLVRTSNVNAQLVEQAIVEFVQSLKQTGLWE